MVIIAWTYFVFNKIPIYTIKYLIMIVFIFTLIHYLLSAGFVTGAIHLIGFNGGSQE
jgi:hypothetical protein